MYTCIQSLIGTDITDCIECPFRIVRYVRVCDYNNIVLHYFRLFHQSQCFSMDQLRNSRIKELESITQEYGIQNEHLHTINETLSAEIGKCGTQIMEVKSFLNPLSGGLL